MLVKIINDAIYNIVTYPDSEGNVHFNPIAHGDNTWYIKTEEVNNCNFEFFDFLKNHDNIEL